MKHPVDCTDKEIKLGDTIVWGRRQCSVGIGSVSKIYVSRNWRGEQTVKIGVRVGRNIATLNKPEYALIVDRLPA